MIPRFVPCLYLMLGVPALAAADDDLVARVREGHRAARESIRTLTATVTCENVHPTQGVFARAKYWRSGDVARVQTGEEGAGTEDFLMKGGEIRQVGRTWPKGQSTKATAMRRPGNDFFCSCDVWREMVIEVTGPAGGQLSLDRRLEGAEGPIRADRDTLDGRACIRLRFSHTYPSGTKSNVTQWHDVGHNYLIRKLVAESAATSHRSVVQVTDFVEPQPGVVFPVRCRRDHYSDGELYQATATTLTDVVINQPVPAAALSLPPIPAGTELSDHINGRVGPVDSNWNPIGPAKPLPPTRTGTSPAAAGLSADAAPSTSEPTSSARWVLIGSITVLLVAAALVIGRRFRRGAQPA